MSYRRLCALLGACLLAAWPGAVPSVRAAESMPLTLRSAVEQTLARNPDLAGFAFRLQAQTGRIATADLAPALTVTAEAQNILGSGHTRGIDAAEATFSLSQVIELGGKRARRVEVAEAGQELITAEQASAELDVLTEVTRRFIHVASDQEQLRLTELATRLAEETLAAVTQRVEAGRSPEVEVRRGRVALARARIEQEHAEHELESSRRRLAALWGETESRFGSVTADLYTVPRPDSFAAMRERLAANPDFLRFATEARLRDAEIRLAEARRRADFSYSAGIRRLQETRDQAFVVSLSVPLQTRARGRGAVQEAEAMRSLTAAEERAWRIRAEAQLFELYQELNHALVETETLRNEVLPETEAALAATKYAFERGRYSYLEWTDAQRELQDVQRALLGAAVNAHLYRNEIERLTGESATAAP